MSEITAVPLRPVARNGLTALWAGIVVLAGVGLGSAWWLARAPAAIAGGPEAFLRYNATRHGVVTTPSGLEYQVVRPGSGPRPTIADVAVIEYKGALSNGTVFDQTKPGQRVPLQVAHVVPGFSEGLMLMPKGSTYRFWIPPRLGYGDQDNGPIPANSVLVFDVTLHDSLSMQAVQAMGGGQQPGM